jgi:hypothetical protein
MVPSALSERLMCMLEWLVVDCGKLFTVFISLGNLAGTDGFSTTLHMIDFIKIPRESGDHVVLLLAHPGLNLLGRYLPPSKVNDLLLADATRTRPTSSHGDSYIVGPSEGDLTDDMEGFDIMDLASFLE